MPAQVSELEARWEELHDEVEELEERVADLERDKDEVVKARLKGVGNGEPTGKRKRARGAA
ncbi:MAG: hypothetical protein ABSG98_11305 [Anaerolineales bacterium]|jgi:predicted nuclease with TOPRIM domain